MSLHIADYGRGLPDGFQETLHDVFTTPPQGAVVGSTYKDYSRMIAVRFVRFGTISVTANTGQGMLFDTGRKVFDATVVSGSGIRGAKELIVSVGAADVVAKDDFARGIGLVITGNLAPRRIYIVGNDAKDSNNRVRLVFDEPLPASFAASDQIIISGNKYSSVGVAAADDKLSAGFCLSRSPISNRYG